MVESSLPRIIPRPEHLLSRNLIDPDALRILYRLHHHGFLAYLVGGCVRDLLLSKDPKDFDIATDAHPQQVRELFRNSRLIGRRFRLVHIFFKGGKFIEVSTFRRRSEFEESGNGDTPRSENSFGTPGEDALRRDITINGIFYNIADLSIVDYVDGLRDLREGIIRCIGDPEEKFPQDPVRMIRVIRHAARKGFVIEEETYASLRRHVEKLTLCSPARVRDEFLRELKEGSARNSMELMVETGMLDVLFPHFRAPLLEPGGRENFLRFASALDDLLQSGEPLSEEFCLAVFLLPLVEFYCPAGGFLPGRRGQGAYQGRVREWIWETLGPLQFPGHIKEGASFLLSAQRTFQEFCRRGILPGRFLQKPYFPQACRLRQIVLRLQGEETDEFFKGGREESIPRHRKWRRRRRRRKNGPHSNGAGGGETRPHAEGV